MRIKKQDKPGHPFLKDNGTRKTQVSCYATLEDILLLAPAGAKTKQEIHSGAKKIAEQAIRNAAAKIQ